jgi:serine/threonine protein kinase
VFHYTVLFERKYLRVCETESECRSTTASKMRFLKSFTTVAITVGPIQTCQVIAGLGYLHRIAIVHGDIKSVRLLLALYRPIFADNLPKDKYSCK